MVVSNKSLEWDFLLDFSHLALSHIYVVLGKMSKIIEYGNMLSHTVEK